MRHVLALTVAPLLTGSLWIGLLGTGLALASPTAQEAASVAPPSKERVVTRAPGARQVVRDDRRALELLASAARELRASQRIDMAERVEELAADLRRAATRLQSGARAAELLAADIEDRATRVAIIELARDAYAALGWETNAAILEWFAAIGRAQVSGSAPPEIDPPASLGAIDGSIMDRMIEVILGAAPLHRELGNADAAKCCMRLARYYIRRDMPGGGTALGAPESPDDAEGRPEEPAAGVPVPLPVPRGVTPPPADDAPARERDLTYVEGRVPVIELALAAYEDARTDFPADERERGATRLRWILAIGKNRIEPGSAVVPPAPSEVTPDLLTEHIRAAGNAYARIGEAESARRCHELANYYERRARGEAIDHSAQGAAAPAEPAPVELRQPAAAPGRRGGAASPRAQDGADAIGAPGLGSDGAAHRPVEPGAGRIAPAAPPSDFGRTPRDRAEPADFEARLAAIEAMLAEVEQKLEALRRERTPRTPNERATNRRR